MKEIKARIGMTSREILFEMFTLQQRLNNETNGTGWESGYTKNNKLISWKRCIHMECAELIDSFAWKHWKSISAPTNWGNVQVEIVDIWHFIMSLLLEYYKNNNRGDIEKIVSDILDSSGFKDFSKEGYILDEKNSSEIINITEKIIHITTSYNIDIAEELLRLYFNLALKCDININSLYRFYVAKNILNKFRQDHGYKEGTYKKRWNGIEDNEVMLEILSYEVQSVEQIYDELEKRYKEL